jgi:hypothetical protein
MATRKQRLLKSAGFLLSALGLFAVAAFLMREPKAPRTERAALEFPRYARPHELDRQRQRSTYVIPERADAGSGEGVVDSDEPTQAPPGRLDPMHVALGAGELQMVFEASALLDSPLGRMLLACLSPEQTEALQQLEEKSGFKPLEQLERVAFANDGPDDDPVLVLSGDVGDITPAAFEIDGELEPYGPKSVWVAEGSHAFGLWNRKIAVLGDVEGVRAALARLEGEEPPLSSPFADEAYGEVYGSLSTRAAAELVPSELRQRLKDAAERLVLHVDTTDDLLLVADVYGQDEEKLRDLGTAIGGALSLGRLHALREDNTLLSDLLDESRVIPGSGSFQLEMALPLSAIEAQLGECARAAASGDERPTNDSKEQ